MERLLAIVRFTEGYESWEVIDASHHGDML
jgi:hypothetical protein